MEVLINVKRLIIDKLFKNKSIELECAKPESNKTLYVEQLSRRVQEDLGLKREGNNDSDYSRYL